MKRLLGFLAAMLLVAVINDAMAGGSARLTVRLTPTQEHQIIGQVYGLYEHYTWHGRGDARDIHHRSGLCFDSANMQVGPYYDFEIVVEEVIWEIRYQMASDGRIKKDLLGHTQRIIHEVWGCRSPYRVQP